MNEPPTLPFAGAKDSALSEFGFDAGLNAPVKNLFLPLTSWSWFVCVIVEATKDERQLTFTEFDPLKGKGKVLRTMEKDPTYSYFGVTDISPDGTTFAISRGYEAETHIRLLSLTGDSDREIAVKGRPRLTAINWSLKGKGLFCSSYSPQGSTLLYVDLKGDARVLWQSKAMLGVFGGVPSPDGRYLAIQGEAIRSNVWMVEDF